MELIPIAHNLSFTYSARLIDGERLPDDFIEFNTNSLRFTVESESQDLDESYIIEVTAECTELYRSKSSSFELIVNYEDSAPFYVIDVDQLEAELE